MATAGSIADAEELAVLAERGPSLIARIRPPWHGWESLAEAERDQLPLWLPVGLVLGVAAWFWLPDRSAWIAFLLMAIAAIPGALALFGWSRWGRALAIFALTAAFGLALIWWKSERVAAPRLERPRVVEFVGRIDRVETLAAEQTVRLVVAPEGEGLPALLRLNVDQDRAEPGL
ncbi:MAG: hypothetical protein ACXW2T_03880, partial [Allosphingosinicella sp.]